MRNAWLSEGQIFLTSSYQMVDSSRIILNAFNLKLKKFTFIKSKHVICNFDHKKLYISTFSQMLLSFLCTLMLIASLSTAMHLCTDILENLGVTINKPKTCVNDLCHLIKININSRTTLLNGQNSRSMSCCT